MLVIVKEEDGVLDMMDAWEPHYPLKHQDYYLITELTHFINVFKIYFLLKKSKILYYR